MTYTLIHLVIAEAFGALLGFGVGLWIGIGHQRRVQRAKSKDAVWQISQMIDGRASEAAEKRLRKTTEDGPQ